MTLLLFDTVLIYLFFVTVQFVEELNRMWCYYEAFLGQTELIAVDPVRRFAKSFSTLKVSQP